MKDYKFLVFTNCKDGTDAEFNTWYDEVHLKDVVSVPGFVGAQRFRVAPTPDGKPRHRYFAVYDVRSDDIAATMGELFRRAESGELPMTEAMDQETIETQLYEAITPYRSASS